MKFRTPNNFKMGKYVLRRFRIGDIILIAGSFTFTLFAIIFYVTNAQQINIPIIILLLVPGGLSLLLTSNLPIFFNFLEYIKFAIKYLKSEKNYYWAGIYQFEHREDDDDNNEEE
ncbi:MAG: hypothetical protein RR598_08445 [Anaerorhabdus sp.]